MTTTTPHESGQPTSREALSAIADPWIRQFLARLEVQLVDVGRDLPRKADLPESQAATVRAILQTFVESGMEFESALELFGQVAVERRSTDVVWNDALNQRRFELIDKEIQGTLTLAERLELAGLTAIMRDHVESETNLPMAGARALHQKLLQRESASKAR